MEISLAEIAIVCGAVFVSGFFHGTVGFGGGLIAVGLMGRFLGVRDASIVVTFPTLILTVTVFFQLRKHASLSRTIPLILASFIGIHFGLTFLLTAQRRVLELAAGVFMIATAVYVMVPRLAHKRWHPVYMGVPCGLFSGLISGAFASGGPPVVAYMATQNLGRLEFVGSLQSVFIIMCLFRLGHLGVDGVLTPRVLVIGMFAAVSILAGSMFGVRLLKRLSDRLMKRIVIALLIVLGCLYLVK